MNVNALNSIETAALKAVKTNEKATINDVINELGHSSLSKSTILEHAGKSLDRLA